MPKLRPVYLMKDGKAIKKYKSIVEAAKDTGTSDKGIFQVCVGAAKTSGGFGWIYADEYERIAAEEGGE